MERALRYKNCPDWSNVETSPGLTNREQDNSSTRQLIDTVFGDNSSTQLKTTHRHFLKTIHRHIIILQLYTQADKMMTMF